MKENSASMKDKLKSLASIIPGNIYAIIALFLVFTLICPPGVFLTFGNILNIVEQSTILSLVAIGSLLAIITRGIDLSLGATMSFAGVTVAYLVRFLEWNMIPAAIVAVGAGTLIGMLNGLIISRTNIAPFIITLGTMNIAKSLALIVSNSMTISANTPSFRFIGGEYFLDIIPYSVFLVLIVYYCFHIITKKSRLGTYIYSVGGNEAAALLTGIDVKKTKFLTYTMSAMLASIAGIVLASRLGSASPGQGDGYEFYGIAAAVVGGASMTGGVGTVWKTLAGVFIISTLRNGLNMARLPTSLQMIVLGAVIISVVTIDTVGRRRKVK